MVIEGDFVAARPAWSSHTSASRVRFSSRSSRARPTAAGRSHRSQRAARSAGQQPASAQPKLCSLPLGPLFTETSRRVLA